MKISSYESCSNSDMVMKSRLNVKSTIFHYFGLFSTIPKHNMFNIYRTDKAYLTNERPKIIPYESAAPTFDQLCRPISDS